MHQSRTRKPLKKTSKWKQYQFMLIRIITNYIFCHHHSTGHSTNGRVSHSQALRRTKRKGLSEGESEFGTSNKLSKESLT